MRAGLVSSSAARVSGVRVDLATREAWRAVDAARGQGVARVGLRCVECWAMGLTVAEMASRVGLTEYRAFRQIQRARCVARRVWGEVEGARYASQQERIREARAILHVMAGDIFEAGILAHWRPPTLGRPVCLEHSVMPHAAAVRAEDIIEEPAPVG